MFPYYSIIGLILLGLIVVLLTIAGHVRQDWTDYALALIIVLVIGVSYVENASAEVEFSDDTKLSIIYIPNVAHSDRSHDYNEDIGLVALGINRWSVGNYTNSFGDDSWFVGYHKPMAHGFHWSVYGATGYDDSPIMPLAGIGYSWEYIFVELTPVLAFFGFKLPLGGE